MSTSTINPVVATEKNKVEEKLIETKVTVIEGKETAVIAHVAAIKFFTLAFSLQEDYENESQFIKDSMIDASRMFLRAECARSVSKWDNLVTKASKMQRYKNVGREKIDLQLRDNPKCRAIYQTAKKAAEYKAQL